MFTPQELQDSLTRKIENHMAAKGISRKQLIEELEMSYHSFKRRMDGEIPFSVFEVWAIAKVLRAAPSDLLPDDASVVQEANAA